MRLASISTQCRHTVSPTATPVIIESQQRRGINDTWQAYWHRNSHRLQALIEDDADPYADFKWRQLVNQEGAMYAALGVVDQGDFDFICRRRGFNQIQRSFLADGLNAIGLGPVC